MANYYCIQKTNDFKVTDEKAYQELFNQLSCEDDIDSSFNIDENGEKTFYFGAYGYIEYIDENEECDMDSWFKKLQLLLTDDSAFILISVGNEKLRTVDGEVTIVTKNDIEYMSLSAYAEDRVNKMLSKKS